LMSEWVLPQLWISELREARDRLEVASAQLKAAMLADDRLEARYWLEGDAIEGRHARVALADWACGREFITPVNRLGLLVASEQTLQLMADANDARRNYARAYTAIRDEAKSAGASEGLASQRAHLALKAIGEDCTDFARVRAQLAA